MGVSMVVRIFSGGNWLVGGDSFFFFFFWDNFGGDEIDVCGEFWWFGGCVGLLERDTKSREEIEMEVKKEKPNFLYYLLI